MNIKYTTFNPTDTFVGVKITMQEQEEVLRILRRGLFDLVQRANYDPNAKSFLLERHPAYKKQTESPCGTFPHNTLASFVGGILEQHEAYLKRRHFSEPQLEGISLASAVFNMFNTQRPAIYFDHANVDPVEDNTPSVYSQLFTEE